MAQFDVTLEFRVEDITQVFGIEDVTYEMRIQDVAAQFPNELKVE